MRKWILADRLVMLLSDKYLGHFEGEPKCCHSINLFGLQLIGFKITVLPASSTALQSRVRSLSIGIKIKLIQVTPMSTRVVGPMRSKTCICGTFSVRCQQVHILL